MVVQRAAFPCRVGGSASTLDPRDDVLAVGGREVDWLDVDGLTATDDSPVRLTLRLADGDVLEVDHLAGRGDECAAVVRELRGRARRAALAQSVAAPLASYVSRGPDGAVSDVHLFAHAVIVEPRADALPVHVPLPLVREVVREGWALTLRCRGIDDVVVRGLGPRTDEFEQQLARARTALGAATREALAGYEPALAGLALADGWPVPAAEAGAHGPALVARWSTGTRAAEVEALRGLTGEQGMRYGIWTEGGTTALPFVLASSGAGARSRVAVEAVEADDRATFVFGTDDVERLAAALVLSAFRREVLSLPDRDLGRWAVAVRTQPHVRWAREALVARVVHDARWREQVSAAMTASA